jgi:hypothetical protein
MYNTIGPVLIPIIIALAGIIGGLMVEEFNKYIFALTVFINVFVGTWNTAKSITQGAVAFISALLRGDLIGALNVVKQGFFGLTNINLYAAGSRIIGSLINGLLSKIGGVRAAVNSIRDTIVSSVSNVTANIDIPGFASGVRNFEGGFAVVGERGPELVRLSRGSDVFSNSESRSMIAGSSPATQSGGGVTVMLKIDKFMSLGTNYDKRRFLEEIGEELLKYINKNNPETA